MDQAPLATCYLSHKRTDVPPSVPRLISPQTRLPASSASPGQRLLLEVLPMPLTLRAASFLIGRLFFRFVCLPVDHPEQSLPHRLRVPQLDPLHREVHRLDRLLLEQIPRVLVDWRPQLEQDSHPGGVLIVDRQHQREKKRGRRRLAPQRRSFGEESARAESPSSGKRREDGLHGPRVPAGRRHLLREVAVRQGSTGEVEAGEGEDMCNECFEAVRRGTRQGLDERVDGAGSDVVRGLCPVEATREGA
mmetsp:Transcript_30952/g.70926  ORF Transcript_30952/g.70926 Transcript_30952/m.70926 type:complete len:248 (+) Transcript_30952:219-962(+)